MVAGTQWMTAVVYVLLLAVLSAPEFMDDDTWMAMLLPDTTSVDSWCPSVIVSARWVLSDQECAVSEALGLTAVAGVRLWSERARGQERKVDAVLKTPFGRLRGVHLLMAFEFNENVSFILMGDGELPVYGLPCRASGVSPAHAMAERRLVSQTVMGMPSSLCTAFGLANIATCARSYPGHFPCGAPPPVWLSCRRLLTGWCYFSRPCSNSYQTHLGHAMHPAIPWLRAKIPELPEPVRLTSSTSPALPAPPPLLPLLLLSLHAALSSLTTLTSVCTTLQRRHS